MMLAVIQSEAHRFYYMVERRETPSFKTVVKSIGPRTVAVIRLPVREANTLRRVKEAWPRNEAGTLMTWHVKNDIQQFV